MVIGLSKIFKSAPEVTQEMRDHFKERTELHISLVQKYLQKIIDLNDSRLDSVILEQEKEHDQSKFEDPEYGPYIHVNWSYKLKGDGKKYVVPETIQQQMRGATFHHIKSNPHHPEYWDDNVTIESINGEDRDKPGARVNASKMPLTYVASMVADWLAMSEEKKTDPYDWVEANVGKRWEFDAFQRGLIFDLLDTVWTKQKSLGLPSMIKHLPGQHDQESHGREGGNQKLSGLINRIRNLQPRDENSPEYWRDVNQILKDIGGAENNDIDRVYKNDMPMVLEAIARMPKLEEGIRIDWGTFTSMDLEDELRILERDEGVPKGSYSKRAAGITTYHGDGSATIRLHTLSDNEWFAGLNLPDSMHHKAGTMVAVAAHEYAHVMDGYNDKFSGTEAWREAWKKNRRVSMMATSSAKEGFAESAALMGIRPKYFQKKYPELYTVISELTGWNPTGVENKSFEQNTIFDELPKWTVKKINDKKYLLLLNDGAQKSFGLAIIKHFPGQHDQQEHAGGRTRKPKEPTVNNPGKFPEKFEDISKDQLMAQADLADIKATASKNLAEIAGPSPKFKKVDGKMSEANAKTIAENMKMEIDRYGGYLAGDTMGRLRDYLDETKKVISDSSLRGLDAATLNSMGLDSIRKMVHQEVESNRQQFTDHGIRHIVGNIQRQSEIMDAMGKTSAKEKLMGQFIMVNHDVGYTVPLVREGGERGIKASSMHKEFSEKILGQQRAAWNEGKVFDSKEYDRILDIVKTHDSAKIDKGDILGTASRLSDNLALFSKEKLPGMFRYVEGGKTALVNMAKASAKKDTATFEKHRDELYKSIDAAKLSSQLKRDLKASVKEVGYLTPKFTLGVLAGEVSSISKSGKGISVDIEYNAWDKFLQDKFDMGQRQTKKLLGDYGITDFSKTEYDIGGIVKIGVNNYNPDPSKPKKMGLVDFFKHLPGQHDQDAHGNDGNGENLARRGHHEALLSQGKTEELLSTIVADTGMSKGEASTCIAHISMYSRKSANATRSSYGINSSVVEKFIEKSPKFDGKVYRGISIGVANKLNEGNIIGLKGFTSWSSSRSVASGFTKGKGVATIELSETNHGTSIKHISANPYENEVLISSKVRFQIEKIEKYDNQGINGKWEKVVRIIAKEVPRNENDIDAEEKAISNVKDWMTIQEKWDRDQNLGFGINVLKGQAKSLTKASSRPKPIDKGRHEEDFRKATQKLEADFQEIIKGYFKDQGKAVLASLSGRKAVGLGTYFKHLPGQHDQESHGGEAGIFQKYGIKQVSGNPKNIVVIAKQLKQLKDNFPNIVEKSTFDSLTLSDDTLVYYGLEGRKAMYYNKKMIVACGDTNGKETLVFGQTNVVSNKDLRGIFRHEYAHVYRSNVFDDGWTKLYLKLDKKVRRQISERAATNSEEGFAESFTAFTSPLYKRGGLPNLVEQYFDNLMEINKKSKDPLTLKDNFKHLPGQHDQQSHAGGDKKIEEEKPEAARGGIFYRASSYDVSRFIKDRGIKRGEEWYGRPPSVYLTDSESDAIAYAQLMFPGKACGVAEIHVPIGERLIKDNVDEGWGAERSYRIERDIPKEWIKKIRFFDSEGEIIYERGEGSKKVYYPIIFIDKSQEEITIKASPNDLEDRFDFAGWTFDKKKWNKRLQEEGGLFIKEMYGREGIRAYDGLKYQVGDLAGAFNMDDPEVQAFLDKYVFTFAENINLTTEELLRGAMKAGMEEGLGMEGIAAKIEGLYDTWGKWRSLLIARTETIRASNRAAAMAYRQSGVVEGKSWLVTRDDRLCPICRRIGETKSFVPLEDNFFDKGDFLVIGEGKDRISMKFDYEDVESPPAHPNCRCSIIPIVYGEYELPKQLGLSAILKHLPAQHDQQSHAPGRTGQPGSGTINISLMRRETYKRYEKLAFMDVVFYSQAGQIDKLDYEELRRLNEHFDVIESIPKSVMENISSIELYDSTEDLGSFTAGGKSFHKGGDFNPEIGKIRVRVFDTPEVLHHEIGHAVVHTLQAAAIRGVSEKYDETGADDSKMFAPNGNMRDPKTPNQRAYGVFEEIAASPNNYGWQSSYAEAWKGEPIVDEGTKFGFWRHDGSMWNASFGNIHRSANENFAEIWKDVKMKRAFYDNDERVALVKDVEKILKEL